MKTIKVVSPVDGEVYIERPLAGEADIAAAIAAADNAGAAWRATPVDRRVELVNRAVDIFVARREEISEEITWQMGRPIRFAPGEVAGFEERARYMIAVAEPALASA